MTEKALSGRVAVVTGASSGIGWAAARALAAEGASVALTARREDRLSQLVEDIEEAGGRALAAPCDVRSPEEVEAAIAATVDAFGTVDILVNNAGVMSASPVSELRVEDNFTTIHMGSSRYFVPHELRSTLDEQEARDRVPLETLGGGYERRRRIRLERER